MDRLLEKQLQSYVPPGIIRGIMNEKVKYQVAKHIIDREFKHKPQRWKTVAFPEYEDFFQAAVVGFNPYKEITSKAKDKGVLQAIESYNPYKVQDDNLLMLEIGNIEQACCPFCYEREELVSMWPASAGNNTIDSTRAPDPSFYDGNKYCGRRLTTSDYSEEQLNKWLEDGLLRRSGKKWVCNYSNRLVSLKNHISNQLNFLVKDIRNEEYHPARSLRRHPHYECPHCHSLVPDFNTTAIKTKELTCNDCENIFKIEDVKDKKIWKSRGSNHLVSLQDSAGGDEQESRGTYEETIAIYNSNSSHDPETFFTNQLDEKIHLLTQNLIDRTRYLAASCVGHKQYQKLLEDPTIPKDDNGIPETLNFQIFYNYFFINSSESETDTINKKVDKGATYRELALRFLKKEQHYTQCNECLHKMYEPTESAKFKKAGTRQRCEICETNNVTYHGPKCGTPKGNNPACQAHGDLEVVMYIFQTIEPKIRRLEELIRKDSISQEIFEKIRQLYKTKDQLEVYTDLARILNF